MGIVTINTLPVSANSSSPISCWVRESEKELEKARTAQALSQGADLAASAKAVGPVTVVASAVGEMPSADALRTLALDVRDRLGNERGTVVALGGVVGGKPSLVVATNEAAPISSLSKNCSNWFKPTDAKIKESRHGQEVSFESIKQINPEIIFVLNRPLANLLKVKSKPMC